MLQKQPVQISFSGDLDTKTDPYQVSAGNFLRLQNTVFDTYKRMTKRNGFKLLSTPPESINFITTLKGNLTGIGNSLLAYSQSSGSWFNKGSLQPVSINTLPLVRNSSNQSQVDSATSSNGLVCVTYAETGSGTTVYKYALIDSNTGQNLLSPAVIPSIGTVTHSARVFFLNPYFVIVFGANVTGTPHLRYAIINAMNPLAPVSSTDISTSFTPASTLAFDGCVYNNRLYLAWNGADVGGAIRTAYLTNTLSLTSAVVYAAGKTGSMISVYVDSTLTSPGVWITFWDADEGYTMLADFNLSSTLILGPVHFITTTTITNLTSTAINGVNTILFEVPVTYGYNSLPSNQIKYVTCSYTGSLGTKTVLARSVGLASKGFIVNGAYYVLSTYTSPDQNTYFLLNSSGQVVSRLAYSNGGGYVSTGLPSVTLQNNICSVSYLFQDLVTVADKSIANSSNNIYSQTGTKLVKFTFGSIPKSVEIGDSLSLTGGFLWGYDGTRPVENNFFLWPDTVGVGTNASGGSLSAQKYFYQVIYQWTDNQGNIQRSAPSIPVSVTTTGATSTNSINIPTLRLTYKVSNPVEIVIYRWSTGQQEFHRTMQFGGAGSVATPFFNDPTVDSVTFIDTLADADILSNELIYTTGGVVEDMGAPSFTDIALFDSRLWGIDAEDNNLLRYSKQIIENTPVEMSDLFTYYTAPSTAVQGSSGPTLCIYPMDDKLILFKQQALYFINGNGPDNTGTNGTYSPNPIFIASTIGCSNPRSIAIIPTGLVFQSDKGIWLLQRDLGTDFIGARVTQYTANATVLSAVSIPGTTQVRFTMSSGITLMYDYFFDKWGTFTNLKGISSTIYGDLHTYVDSSNKVYQETPGVYLDGTKPVLQSFTTGWLSVSGLIGFQRVYWADLLGTYYSPHKLQIQVAYDYNSNPTQSTTITPNNFGGQWGNDIPAGNPGNWGGSQYWGGSGPSGNVEKQRLFFNRGKCSSIQLIVDELYDPSLGVVAGQGLSLSGITITAGFKKGYPTPSAAESSG